MKEKSNVLVVDNTMGKPKLFIYVLTLLLMSYSGNPLIVFSESLRELCVFALVFLAGCCVYYNKSYAITKAVVYIAPYILLFIFQLMLVRDLKPYSFYFIVIKTFIGIFSLLLIGKNFFKVFVDLMVLISAISLIGFAYNTFIGLLPSIAVTEIAHSSIIYTQLFSLDGAFIGRNAGMFWEPGAFQGFINLAFFIIYIFRPFTVSLLSKLILLGALITTFSTTGYIAFFFIIVANLAFSRGGNPIIKLVLLFAVFVVAAYLFNSIDFLGNKIQGDSSSEGRIGSYILSWHMIEEHPIIGNSYIEGSELTQGNGFLYQLISVGLLGSLYYYYIIYVNQRRYFDNIKTILFIAFLILIYQGEGFLMYSLFLAMPFINNEKKRKKNER